MRTRVIKAVTGGIAVVMVGTMFVIPAWAVETKTGGNICDNLTTAWTARESAYSRAKTIRTTAFSKTNTRWMTLFDKLDAKGISTTTVRADATSAAGMFNNLLAADDGVIAAMKAYATASCAKTGVDQARKDLKTAQDNRKLSRQAYVKALRLLATDLAKLRSTK